MMSGKMELLGIAPRAQPIRSGGRSLRAQPTTELGNDYGEKLRNSFKECKLNFWQFARLPVRRLKTG
jgi:hypothetical protein